jgi:hypothetical protein
MACAGGVIFLGKRETQKLLVTSRESGVEVNSETQMYVHVLLVECRTASLHEEN